MACLIELDTKRCHPLNGTTIIGRGDSSQIRIDDPMVSLTHAAVEQAPDGGYHVRDLGSRRGTFVGARKVSEAPLRDGDELLIGPVRLRFEGGQAAAGSEREELIRLRAIVELSRAIGVEHDLDRLLARVLDTCFDLLDADRGAIVIYEPGSKAPFLTVTRSHTGEDVAVSTSVLGQVMVSHEPFLRTEVDTDQVLQRSESLTSRGVRSVMAVPLRYDANETEWLGVIQLDSRALANVFGPRDLDLLGAIAGPTALAIKNAMLVRQVRSVIGEEWRRLERVVRDLPLGVVVLDDANRCVLVNQWAIARARELGELRAGTSVDAIAGIACERLIEATRPTHVATESERLLAITANALREGRETVIVINDLTEERERQNRAAHRDRVELVGQLAGGIAHDFNNLLHVIMTYSNMLEETIEDPDQRDDAHQISQAAKSAAELTRQLLTYSRRELVKPTVVDVSSVVRGMEKLLQRTLGPQVVLAVDIAPRIPRILIDPSQLDQILMNLVINARDAMLGKGRIGIAVRGRELADGESRALPAGRYVELEVSDDGPGMAPEVMARIFEPYFTTKARGMGTGLGLATVHGIVLQAQGEIVVESQPGRGTTFRVLVPATEQPSPQARPTGTDTPERSTAILVVDDDDHVRRVTERMLRSAGFGVRSASSGPAALDLLAQHPAIDLLLTDVVMPGMSGRDLARQVEAAHPEVRVIFMSGYHQHAPLANGQFVAKPFRRDELLDKIHAVLASPPGAWRVG